MSKTKIYNFLQRENIAGLASLTNVPTIWTKTQDFPNDAVCFTILSLFEVGKNEKMINSGKKWKKWWNIEKWKKNEKMTSLDSLGVEVIDMDKSD